MATILNASSSSGLVAQADTSAILQLQTNGTPTVTVDTSGNMGIGTASPASYGKLASVGTNTSAALLNVRDEGTPTGNLVSISANSLGTALAVNSAGNTRVLNLGLGGTTPSTSGTGITFPATQSASSDANTLDDYEEGTFTSSVTCSVSGTLTTTYNTGAYTKVGRLVTVTGYIQFSSVSSPNGYMRITLPFSTASGVQFESSACFAFNNIVSGNIVDFCGVVNSNSSSFDIYAGTGTTLSASSANLMQANTSFRFSATYMTA
jgi:hypothetical protein